MPKGWLSLPMAITVDDTPAGVSWRTCSLSYSRTNRLPLGASAMLTGLSNPTAAAAPSARPDAPDPASVETTTPGTKSTVAPTGAPGAGGSVQDEPVPPLPLAPPFMPTLEPAPPAPGESCESPPHAPIVPANSNAARQASTFVQPPPRRAPST